MSIVGDLFSGAADLIGGHLGRKSQRAENDKERELQREFAQSGIRWKVADAQAAGVHPLFALGASTQGYTPSAVAPDYSDIGRAGQHLGNAVSKAMDVDQRALVKAQVRAVMSETGKNDAEASLARTMAMLNLRDFQGPAFPGPFPDMITDAVSGAHVRRAPALDDIQQWDLPPGGKEISAGPQAYGWQNYDFGHGPVTLFRGDPDQLMSDLQDMDAATRAAILAENIKRGQGAAIRHLFSISDKRPNYGGSKDRNPRVGPGGGYVR